MTGRWKGWGGEEKMRKQRGWGGTEDEWKQRGWGDRIDREKEWMRRGGEQRGTEGKANSEGEKEYEKRMEATHDPPKPCSDEVLLSGVPSCLRPSCSDGL